MLEECHHAAAATTRPAVAVAKGPHTVGGVVATWWGFSLPGSLEVVDHASLCLWCPGGVGLVMSSLMGAKMAGREPVTVLVAP